MMKNLDNIFVIINPTRTVQRGLSRAAGIARTVNAKLHAYVCVYSDLETNDPAALKQVETERYQMWLDRIVEPVRQQGIEIDTIVEWDRDWRHAAGAAARKLNADLIVKPSNPRTIIKNRLMTSSDFALFKSASCSVLVVKSDDTEMSGNVLMAVDCKRESEEYRGIMEEVLAHGVRASTVTRSGELHAVNSYSTQDEYVHVTDVVKRTGLAAKFVHVVGAEPEEAIAKVAAEIDAALVIIGLSTKSSLFNRVFGNTAEWLLNNLQQDILVVVPEDQD